ncbi:MAG TPA: 2-dehydro-3-deoxy-6-phosphogalactonate aldolase [Rhodanobacteraceae bacterium]
MLPAELAAMPLVAILRGVRPDEVVAVGDAIVDAGFRVLEVPLNSPQPLDSIARLAKRFGSTCLVGAGTVMTATQVAGVAAAGGRLIVMPHADTEVIRAAAQADLVCMPGVATVTEAFAAIAAGASALKAFPGTQVTPDVLHAWRAVLPRDMAVLPVGGVTPETMAVYTAAGAAGFGIGSALYKPGRSIEEIATAAARFVAAWRICSRNSTAS